MCIMLLLLKIFDDVPLSLEDALEHDHWVEAVKSKIEAIYENTLELCNLPRGRNSITTNWIYKVKCNADGSHGSRDHFKARGCSQKELSGLPLEQPSPTCLFTDNQSALAVAGNPVFHARTKHIEVHYT